MAWYNKFPWTNFHEINMDWILDVVKASTDNANDAANRADAAANKIVPVTATAATVYGSGASVTVEDTNPGMALHFFIPAGQKGDPGPSGDIGDMIVNGNFSNPVNQRGSSVYNGNGDKMYTIDGWFTTSTASPAVAVNNRFISVANGATINQIIPASNDESFPSDSDVGYTAVAREIDGTVHIANSSISDSKLSFVIGEANSGITVTLGSGNWEYCALYKGVYTRDNIPGYVPKNFSSQLSSCQYYFERQGKSISAILGSPVFVPANSTSAIFSIKYSPKRITSPTLYFSNVNQYRLLFYNALTGEQYAVSNVLTINNIISENPYAYFRVGFSTPNSVDSFAVLQRQDGATSAFIDISADM